MEESKFWLFSRGPSPFQGHGAGEADQQSAGAGPEGSLGPGSLPLPGPRQPKRRRQDQEQGLQAWQESKGGQRRTRSQRWRLQPCEGLTGHRQKAWTGQSVCKVRRAARPAYWGGEFYTLM